MGTLVVILIVVILAYPCYQHGLTLVKDESKRLNVVQIAAMGYWSYIKVILVLAGLVALPLIGMMIVFEESQSVVENIYFSAITYDGDDVFTQILNKVAKVEANIKNAEYKLMAQMVTSYIGIMVGIICSTVVLGTLIIYHRKK